MWIVLFIWWLIHVAILESFTKAITNNYEATCFNFVLKYSIQTLLLTTEHPKSLLLNNTDYFGAPWCVHSCTQLYFVKPQATLQNQVDLWSFKDHCEAICTLLHYFMGQRIAICFTMKFATNKFIVTDTITLEPLVVSQLYTVIIL